MCRPYIWRTFGRRRTQRCWSERRGKPQEARNRGAAAEVGTEPSRGNRCSSKQSPILNRRISPCWRECERVFNPADGLATPRGWNLAPDTYGGWMNLEQLSLVRFSPVRPTCCRQSSQHSTDTDSWSRTRRPVHRPSCDRRPTGETHPTARGWSTTALGARRGYGRPAGNPARTQGLSSGGWLKVCLSFLCGGTC